MVPGNACKTVAKVILACVILFCLVVLFSYQWNISDWRSLVPVFQQGLTDEQLFQLIKAGDRRNPLGRTFYHFERNRELYLEKWRRNRGDVL